MKIRVAGVPEHFNFPWHQAAGQDLFEKQSIQLSWTDFPGGTGAMAKALRDNEVDMALVLTEGITADILNGNKAVIAGFYVSSPLVWGIHVAKNSAIQTIADMEGKRYAISRKFSGSHLMPFVHASPFGWGLSEESFVEVGNLSGAETALTEGKAELFFWEKFTTQPLVDAGKFRRIGECPTPWPCFAFAVRTEFYLQYKFEVQALIHFIRQYSAQQITTPGYAGKVAERYSLKIDQVQEWLQTLRYSDGSENVEEVLVSVVEHLKKTGVLKPDASMRSLQLV